MDNHAGLTTKKMPKFDKDRQILYHSRIWHENNTVSNTTLNVSLPEPLKEYVQERVSEGITATPAITCARLSARTCVSAPNRRLETLMLEGINSGDPVTLDGAEWESIQQEVQKRLPAKRQGA